MRSAKRTSGHTAGAAPARGGKRPGPAGPCAVAAGRRGRYGDEARGGRGVVARGAPGQSGGKTGPRAGSGGTAWGRGRGARGGPRRGRAGPQERGEVRAVGVRSCIGLSRGKATRRCPPGTERRTRGVRIARAVQTRTNGEPPVGPTARGGGLQSRREPSDVQGRPRADRRAAGQDALPSRRGCSAQQSVLHWSLHEALLSGRTEVRPWSAHGGELLLKGMRRLRVEAGMSVPEFTSVCLRVPLFLFKIRFCSKEECRSRPGRDCAAVHETSEMGGGSSRKSW